MTEEVPRRERPAVSVIIASYARLEDLRRCVADLGAQQGTAPFEVILVLQGYAKTEVDDLSGLLSHHVQRLVLSFHEPLGVFGARNTGLRHASGDVLAFIDDDCRVPATWVSTLASLYTDAQVGGVGGFVNHPGRGKGVRRLFYALWGINPRRYKIDWGGFHSMPQFDPPNITVEADWLSGGNMSFRRSAIMQVGSFEAIYGVYGFDDADISLRVRRAGWKLLVSSRLTVDHFPSSSSRHDHVARAHEEERHRVYFAYLAIGRKPLWKVRFAARFVWHWLILTQVALYQRRWRVPFAAASGALQGLREVDHLMKAPKPNAERGTA